MSEPRFGQVMKDGDGTVMGMYICPTPRGRQYKDGIRGEMTHPHLVILVKTYSPAWEDIEDFPDAWTFSDD